MPTDTEIDTLEQEIAGYAQVVKERYQEYRHNVALAESGALCVVCKYRKMATEGGLGCGEKLCEACATEALSIYQDAVGR